MNRKGSLKLGGGGGNGVRFQPQCSSILLQPFKPIAMATPLLTCKRVSQLPGRTGAELCPPLTSPASSAGENTEGQQGRTDQVAGHHAITPYTTPPLPRAAP